MVEFGGLWGFGKAAWHCAGLESIVESWGGLERVIEGGT